MRRRTKALLAALVLSTLLILIAWVLSGWRLRLTDSDAGVWLNALIAVGTVGVVILALEEIATGRESLDVARQATEVGRENARAARDNAEAARAAAKEARLATEAGLRNAEVAQAGLNESIKARLDANAPRVILLFREVEPRVYMHSYRRTMPGWGEPTLWEDIAASRALQGTEELFLPNDDKLIWFTAYGLLKNEGDRSAVVGNLYAEFVAPPAVEEPNVFPFDDVESSVSLPPAIGDPLNHQYLLRAGETAILRWSDGRPLSEWVDGMKKPDPTNPHNFLFLNFSVWDALDPGSVILVYWAEMHGRPILEVSGKNNVFMLSPLRSEYGSRIGVGAQRPGRWYQALNEEPPSSPGNERFREYQQGQSLGGDG